jgi:hypothetical protein
MVPWIIDQIKAGWSAPSTESLKNIALCSWLTVNFINVLHTNFSYERRFSSLHVTRENDVRTKNVLV